MTILISASRTPSLASAAVQLDPHVVMQVMQSEEDPAGGVAVGGGMVAAFDDGKVAQLLATALALEGGASDRLATIFNTIAPDEDRKRRVLTMTRALLSETDFGKSGQFQVLWASVEELLIAYNEAPFVSDSYRVALDSVGGRADQLAAGDLPPELPESGHGRPDLPGLPEGSCFDDHGVVDRPELESNKQIHRLGPGSEVRMLLPVAGSREQITEPLRRQLPYVVRLRHPFTCSIRFSVC